MVNQNFTVTRGSTLQFRINFIDADSLPDNIYLHVKNKSSDTSYILQLQLNNGIEKVQGKDSYDVYIPAIDTEGLELLNYIYQIIFYRLNHIMDFHLTHIQQSCLISFQCLYLQDL